MLGNPQKRLFPQRIPAIIRPFIEKKNSRHREEKFPFFVSDPEKCEIMP
jgi:hypothetical protein